MSRPAKQKTTITRRRDVGDGVNVMFTLYGQDAEDFLAYKEREIIRSHSNAGERLALERLRQWKAEAPAAA